MAWWTVKTPSAASHLSARGHKSIPFITSLCSLVSAGWLVDWLVGWLGGWLVGWMVGWLVGWLVG